MNKAILNILVVTFTLGVFAQEYQFETIIDLETSTVKSQGQTGTCWSFSTTSFLESEIYRLTGEHIDIAEMYLVRNTYKDKAWNYVMRQGKTQLSEGGLAHDVTNAVTNYGLVPQSAYIDIFGNEQVYNHKTVVSDIKKILDAYIKNDQQSEYPDWQSAITPLLNKQIGVNPIEFNYNNQTFSSDSFKEYAKIVPENYISITSFTHQKAYSNFVLNIPDNFSNGSFYNVSLGELVNITNTSLEKGFSISLDVDVSEKTFSSKYGLAILPDEGVDPKKIFTEIVPEIEVTESYRQKEFENFNTTDDHLMHITGLVEDQQGNHYYKVKNSWGRISNRVGNNGFIYMSVPYFKLKSISIFLHKEALSKEMTTKLGL